MKKFIDLVKKINVLNLIVISWFLFSTYCWVLSYFKSFTLIYIKIFTVPAILIILLTVLIKFLIYLGTLRVKPDSNLNTAKSAEEIFVSFVTKVLIVILLGFQLFVIYKMPPINWDSMTYHLSKITLSLQNSSMILPPDIPVTRIISSPWNSEISNLALYSFLNSDMFVELSQFLAALGILLLINKYFKNNQDWLILALLSVPLFVSQMITTQNDLLLYFLAFYTFISLEDALLKPSVYNFILFIIGGALLVGTKVNGFPILGVIVLVLSTHYIYKTYKNRLKLISFEKRSIIGNIIKISTVFLLAIIVAFPSYYYSKKVYDNFLYQPPETASKFKIGIPTIQENLIHFGYKIIKPQQHTNDIYNQDTGHLGNVFIFILLSSFIAFIASKKFRKEIMSNSLFQVAVLSFLVFITIHSPDLWDLRLVLFPLLTIIILLLYYLSQSSTYLKNILVGVVILGSLTNIIAWAWFITPNIIDSFKKENYGIADFVSGSRPSLFSLYEDPDFKTQSSKSIMILASEDTWLYPYFNVNNSFLNKIYFSKDYKESNYDYVVLDKYLFNKPDLKSKILACNTLLGEDIYTIIYKRDLNKCNRDLVK